MPVSFADDREHGGRDRCPGKPSSVAERERGRGSGGGCQTALSQALGDSVGDEGIGG